ncbi:hypothetical protein GCM10007940_41830 [Portibacter lacus]|uniref:Uncharacterized protein n=1 Tax=Portibacter lacus TaxID=1099794 RepID=A0AA37ST20_9BACT|nr:hypothetical protein GCM10007940_41830 [Portibacter lacus]
MYIERINITSRVQVSVTLDSSRRNTSMLNPYEVETKHVASSKGFIGDNESEVSWTANICTE